VIAATTSLPRNRLENNRLRRGSSSRECDESQCSECELHVSYFMLKNRRREEDREFI
jgi:hypothetical protein